MGAVVEGSKRLDSTLSSNTFALKEGVACMVKNQLLKSPILDNEACAELVVILHNAAGDAEDKLGRGNHIDDIVQFWSGKVWTFLDDLRSASSKHTAKLVPTNDTEGSAREWKLKDETSRYRVMYREGPEGTPFHTLCLDGAVDGDFTSALCVAWECPLYKEWWPQFMVPTFRITESKWLRRVRVGMDLSLLRFKVPWPLTAREVLISAFELEHLEEGLIIGLMGTVPEGEEIDEKLFGFGADDLPVSSSSVRMDIAGGFVMQRVSKEQFFFRTIVNIDMKLDLVPAWLINFISRQVAGQGLKLYQKAVLAATNDTGSGKKFQKPLRTGVMYDRIRANQDLWANRPLTETIPASRPKSSQGSIRRMGSVENNRVVPFPVLTDDTKEEPSTNALSGEPASSQADPSLAMEKSIGEASTTDSKKLIPQSRQSSRRNDEDREYEDPEVEWAVNTLDRMILFTRTCAGSSGSVCKSLIDPFPGPTSTGSAEVLGVEPRSPRGHDGDCNIVLVNPDAGAVDTTQNSSGTPATRCTSGNPESSGMCTSEIEVIAHLSETDADLDDTHLFADYQQSAAQPQVDMKQRRRKKKPWRWACFSPSQPKRPALHREASFFDGDKGAEAPEGHCRSRLGDSARFVGDRRYASDGKEITVRKLPSRGHPSDRCVTLGDLLIDGKG